VPPVVVPPRDHGRFRGGFELDGGFLKSESTSLGAIGPSGQLGYQVNNLVGVYAVPGITFLVGPAIGVDLTAGLVVDFTFLEDRLTVGAGPEASIFAFLGSNAAGGSDGYGGRVHVAWNAYLTKGDDGIRRGAFVIAFDGRFLVGPEITATATPTSTALGTNLSENVTKTSLTVLPLVSLGYVAF
jgi:hypothetical protein